MCCLSCRFESRWIQVNIAEDSPSIWLKGMGGSTVGVWAAHGEGQVLFPDAAVQAAVVEGNLAPIRWVLTFVRLFLWRAVCTGHCRFLLLRPGLTDLHAVLRFGQCACCG